jgi:hypothetical protein
MTAWIKISSYDQWLSSLILCDGFPQGSIHWQVSDSGELITGVNDGETSNVFSESVIGLDKIGRWLFVAMTYDSNTKTVTHFLNGEKVASGQIFEQQKVKLGLSEIGNWRKSKERRGIRGFNGVMDEFVIFSRAIDGADIKNQYLKGKP